MVPAPNTVEPPRVMVSIAAVKSLVPPSTILAAKFRPFTCPPSAVMVSSPVFSAAERV